MTKGYCINKPELLSSYIEDETNYIRLPSESKLDNLISDMLKSINNDIKAYNAVPMGSEIEGPIKKKSLCSSYFKESTAKQVMIPMNENEKVVEVPEEESSDISMVLKIEEPEPIEKPEPEPESELEIIPAKTIPSEIKSETKDTFINSNNSNNSKNVESFGNSFMESSTLTWILVIILILLVLYLANRHFHIIRL